MSSLNTPFISVIIPAYNHAKYIEQCINSIWDLEFTDIEILAIDDGSSDESLEILLNLKRRSIVPMEVLSHVNMGSCKTVNRGIEISKGEYVLMIASDDYYSDNNDLVQLIQFAKNNPKCPLLYSNGKYVGSKLNGSSVHNEKIISYLKGSSIELLNYISNSVPRPLLIQTCLIKRRLLIEIGLLDEDVRIDDWALNLKMLNYLVENELDHKFINVDIFRYRIHGNNYHSNSIMMINSIAEIANKYIKNNSKNLLLSREYLYYSLFFLKTKNFILGSNFLLKGFNSFTKYTFNILRMNVKKWI